MSSESAVDTVMSGLESVRPWQEDLYRDLHRHPELAHREERTAGLVAERLGDSGFEVHQGVGGTGVVGILRNGEGPSVLLRADMDAIAVREQTGLDYASEDSVPAEDGGSTPVMHACGHDAHVTSLLGAAALLAQSADSWAGTVVALFQPAEETGTGAQAMVDDGLVDLVGTVDVALAQHVLPLPAGRVATRVGETFSSADSVRITVFGTGSHGSMPQYGVDPVVLAAAIVLRLQTIVSRELSPKDSAVVTVGSIHAGTASNIIGDQAVLEINVRQYDEQVRTHILSAITRIAEAEAQASNAPRKPTIEVYGSFPGTENDEETTTRVRAAFDTVFGENSGDLAVQTASEDFSHLPDAFGAPFCYWGIGGIDPETYAAAEAENRVMQDIPTNHSPTFAPVIQPTLDAGTTAMVTAALAWLAPEKPEPGGDAGTGH